MGIWQWTFELWCRIREPAITRNTRVSKCESVNLHWITIIVALPAHCALMICSGSWWLLCDRMATINICTSGTKLKFRCLSTEIMDCSSCRDVLRCCTRCRAVCTVGCLRLVQQPHPCWVGKCYGQIAGSWQNSVPVAIWCTTTENTHVCCVYMYIFNLRARVCVRACTRVIFRYQDGVRNITETHLPYNFVKCVLNRAIKFCERKTYLSTS